MAREFYQHKSYVFRSSPEEIPNIFTLPRIGAGHDGYVFKFNDKALKLLKYDISLRKEKRLMTFAKAVYFQEELDLKRFTKPIDILLDEEGVYSGYVMEYLEEDFHAHFLVCLKVALLELALLLLDQTIVQLILWRQEAQIFLKLIMVYGKLLNIQMK